MTLQAKLFLAVVFAMVLGSAYIVTRASFAVARAANWRWGEEQLVEKKVREMVKVEAIRGDK